MSVSRLEYITKIGVEQMGELADSFQDSSLFKNYDMIYISKFNQLKRCVVFFILLSTSGWLIHTHLPQQIF